MRGLRMKKFLLGFTTIVILGQTAYADMEDDPLVTMLLMDQFEVLNDAENTRAWEGSFWMGHDLNKLYIYSTGEATKEGLETSQNELVYSRAIKPMWDIQVGLAYDKNADASQTWGEVAISGLAPYYFETRAAVLLNDSGNIGLRIDLEYEALLTQKLILTPSLEADFYTKDDPEMNLGSGLSSVEAGLRLRYEFKREFAPYIGAEWEKTFGNTQHYNPTDDIRMVFGVRFWF